MGVFPLVLLHAFPLGFGQQRAVGVIGALMANVLNHHGWDFEKHFNLGAQFTLKANGTCASKSLK